MVGDGAGGGGRRSGANHDLRDRQRMDRRPASGTEPVADPREALPTGTVRTTAAQEPAALPPHDSDGRLRGAASLSERVPGGRGGHRTTSAAVGKRLVGGRT